MFFVVREIKDSKKWYKTWWGIVLLILAGFFIIGVLFGEESQTINNSNSNSNTESELKTAVTNTNVVKVNYLLYPEFKNYSFVTAQTTTFFSNVKFKNVTELVCGSTNNYPDNISVLSIDSGFLIMNPANYDILCDYTYPDYQEQYNNKITAIEKEKTAQELNNFPKVAESDKYKITLLNMRKSNIGGTIWLDVSFKSENKQTGEIIPDHSQGLSMTDCMSYSVFLIDLQTQTYFMIMDTVSQCGRSIRYSEKKYTLENKTVVYLKDINRPMKLVITTNRPISTNKEAFFEEVKRGYGDDLHIFDVDVYNLPVK